MEKTIILDAKTKGSKRFFQSLNTAIYLRN